MRQKKNILKGKKIVEGRLQQVQKELRIGKRVLTQNRQQSVSKSLQPCIIDKLHKGIHPVVEKLYKLIKDRFYCPNSYRFVQNVLKSCETCQKCKTSNRPPNAPLIPPHPFLSLWI